MRHCELFDEDRIRLVYMSDPEGYKFHVSGGSNDG